MGMGCRRGMNIIPKHVFGASAESRHGVLMSVKPKLAGSSRALSAIAANLLEHQFTAPVSRISQSKARTPSDWLGPALFLPCTFSERKTFTDREGRRGLLLLEAQEER
jgi:hypothetical protein